MSVCTCTSICVCYKQNFSASWRSWFNFFYHQSFSGFTFAAQHARMYVCMYVCENINESECAYFYLKLLFFFDNVCLYIKGSEDKW